MKKILTLVFLVLLVIFGGCFYYAQDKTNDQLQPINSNLISEKIDASEFEQKYRTGDYVVIDVRTPEEYATGRVVSDSILINFYDKDFKGQLNLLDKNQPYLIHCRSGARSGKTLSIMKELGFTEVHDLIGGKNAWVESGRELVNVN